MNPIFQPEVVDAVEVDRSYLQVVAEGMRMVNQRESDTEYYTGATYVDWGELENQGIVTAGKTGTAEYCDNIAISRECVPLRGHCSTTHSADTRLVCGICAV
ncbi:MAG: hypothetical protein R3C44_00990 [Chloroflexota bacterium]